MSANYFSESLIKKIKMNDLPTEGTSAVVLEQNDQYFDEYDNVSTGKIISYIYRAKNSLDINRVTVRFFSVILNINYQ